MEVDYCNVSIVIAAYNAAGTLPMVLNDLKQRYPDVHLVLVNDGSTDSTALVGESSGVTVLTHPSNRGVGAAFKTGITYALGRDSKYVVTIGADNQRDVSDISSLILKLISSKEIDVVIGEKYSAHNSIPVLRRAAGQLVAAAFRMLFGSSPPIRDPLSGFRVFNRRAAQLALRAPDGYDFEIACCCLLTTNGYSIREVPVFVRYHSDSTKMRVPLLVLIGIVACLIRMKFDDLLFGKNNHKEYEHE